MRAEDAAMHPDDHDWKTIFIREFRKGAAVSLWAATSAACGAVAGGLFGLIFGVALALVRGDAGRVVPSLAYLALCGAVVGALMGGIGRWNGIIGPAASAHTSDAVAAAELPCPGKNGAVVSGPTAQHGTASVARPDRVWDRALVERQT
ncbi:hypothetical protein AYO44_07330 [Planctomycetaceae bacterium SCGC AG-212-F19]|nr:hypothetical protein AYO44_07330 [Planctomycetaceae bacterium SCGC AG-212-F19]